ncbi:hypothetical protein FA13DRAFT_1738650 [Coprinellus micaceus]|uniref:Uncharacterized protein n=1 Tax=Coprinellus micaceus TaxID=71717 RepID=A0A4Y7ST36_COPMI|nr:hypothetical protein FA13DRAFT_1738650 [Coprinellus micaceus]
MGKYCSTWRRQRAYTKGESTKVREGYKYKYEVGARDRGGRMPDICEYVAGLKMEHCITAPEYIPDPHKFGYW